MKQTPPLHLPLAADTWLALARQQPAQETQSVHQRLALEHTGQFGRLYSLGGDAMAAEADEFMLHESLAHFAALSHSAPRRALILGGGDGASARELLKHPSLTQIVVAELDPEVPRMIARDLPRLAGGAFDDARVALRIGDAAATLQAAFDRGERFELILFDLTASEAPACAHLHAEDFLRLCRESLSARGIIHVQLGSPFYQAAQCAALYRRLSALFPRLQPALISVPLYGGPWLLARAGLQAPGRERRTVLARRLLDRRISGLRYYNPALHLASQALPNYITDLLA